MKNKNMTRRKANGCILFGDWLSKRKFRLRGPMILLLLTLLSGASAAGTAARERTINLASGWSILQDVHDSGERLGLYKCDWNPFGIGPGVSDWEPIQTLTHLQLLLAPQPYFGRELRYFNNAPWWYRLEFKTPMDGSRVTLRFEGVDYYAKVWLNGTLLGEHEGYFEPFEFQVGHLLNKDAVNLLIVRVASPWDMEVARNGDGSRFFSVIRRMIKGTYEHDDTFVQRDVNPIGIWRPVKLIVHSGLRSDGSPVVRAQPSADGAKAVLSVSWPVAWEEGAHDAEFVMRVLRDSGEAVVVERRVPVLLKDGANVLAAEANIASPALWNTWDRGGPELYRADLEVLCGGQVALAQTVSFGIRSVAVRRGKEESTFLLNGKPLYLRAATYWADEYISAANRARYERDIAAAIKAGINTLRVHVHVENPEFYDICDSLGVAVFQDFDLNWTFPTDEEFTRRAMKLFGGMIDQLRNHPSIICWIAMNEAAGGAKGAATTQRPGPQLVAEATRIDPSRPVIRNSGARADPESLDGHDYRGSLSGGHFLDIYGSKEALSTEFGIDAPPVPKNVQRIPCMAERLREVLPRVAELHDYQYHLTKYYIEHYRIQKYAPNAGYFLFMFIDFSPQSFYGVYDYWGRAKDMGIGGGLRALEESNQPIGIFMEYKDRPVAIHAVNDYLKDLGLCTASWKIETEAGLKVLQGKARVRLGPDMHAQVASIDWQPQAGVYYRVVLTLNGPDGKELTRNVYHDPFNPPKHPEGHPKRMDHEIGMRLWWAGINKYR